MRKDTGEVFSRASGLDEENMRRVAVDLRPLPGKEIFIRLVDRHSGGWGHINFDDFRFHADEAERPAAAEAGDAGRLQVRRPAAREGRRRR